MVGGRIKVTFVAARTNVAALCRCGVIIPHHLQLVGLRNKVTFVSSHTQLVVLYTFIVGDPHHR